MRITNPYFINGFGARHTHATQALGRGAELTTIRDNLRHASVSTTSIYLHSDEVDRARQIEEAFATRK
ncbi:tyrosine-type recombinase/integrase [Paraburkholderia fynbosensis]|uniref:tyrosine-type recombinase/integrase n=1 Tax=Paraburkholderia fynbosensis TaxID=1200993 RepID=UPI003CCC9852